MAINNSSISLQTTDYFKNTLETSFQDISNKYISLINEYIKFISENFTNKNNYYSENFILNISIEYNNLKYIKNYIKFILSINFI